MSDIASELIRHQGLFYQAFIGHLARILPARNYFEIGTAAGDSLAAIDCPAIAVDPLFQIARNVVGRKPACHFFQMTSDAFFEKIDPKAYFGQPIDLAFLDGLHLFECVLRDFINTERHCTKDSVILLHDCLPPTFEMTCRQSIGEAGNETGARGHPDYLGYWTGDVWKMATALREYRPDLRLLHIDAPPTGLLLCTGLDPNSSLLLDRYEEITRKYMPSDEDQDRLKQFYGSVALTGTAALMTRSDLMAHLGRAAP